MTEKNKGGRPLIVLTDEQRSELETLAAVLNVEQIADYFGISRRVFYDIMERDEEVSAQYKKGKAKAVGFVAQNLIQKARSGDLGAQIFYLKTQAGWKETQRLEGAGNDGEHVLAYKWLDDGDEDD
jgi:predicted DNA-binding transcriptional regulator AlpA